MAASVTSWTGPADWTETGTGTRSVTGVTWSSGDLIVVGGAAFDSTVTLGVPTNANLTFTELVSLTDGGSSESPVWFWTATASTSQSSQTISCTISNSSRQGQPMAWVIAGAGAATNTGSSRSEAAISRTVAAESLVVFLLIDFNATAAGRTGTTGSGTHAERLDTQVPSAFYVWAGDWTGTSSGTFNFGITDYTSLKVGQIVFEVQAPPPPGVWIVP